MDIKFVKIAIALIIVFTIFTSTSYYVVADQPIDNFPSPPNSVPSSGSGGGGGSSYTYSAPVFTPYTDPLKSGDGTVIGNLEGKNFNDVGLSAETNGTVGNVSYDLTVAGELSSLPSGNYWLDIHFLSPGSADVPLGMDNGLVLGVINITSNPDGWSYTSGPTYTLTITGLSQSPDPNDTYYLVLSKGASYQVQKVGISVSGNETTLQFTPQGATGIFTIMRAPIATPTPSPTPSPTAVPTPTPTPLPINNGMWGFPILLGMFAIGAVAGAAILFILKVNR